MSYQSPIEVIYNDIEYHFEDAVFKAIQKVDIKADRNELIKALEYDRAQYDKGYSDGRFARDSEIVRCKDCKWAVCAIGGKLKYCKKHDPMCINKLYYDTDFFCRDGERREDG